LEIARACATRSGAETTPFTWKAIPFRRFFDIDSLGRAHLPTEVHAMNESSPTPARRRRKAVARGSGLPASLQQVNLNAAGIDVGAAEHYVAVPEDRDPRPVRRFSCFTADLARLADWLEACHVDTVVMESTGVYWIPLFQVLE